MQNIQNALTTATNAHLNNISNMLNNAKSDGIYFFGDSCNLAKTLNVISVKNNIATFSTTAIASVHYTNKNTHFKNYIRLVKALNVNNYNIVTQIGHELLFTVKFNVCLQTAFSNINVQVNNNNINSFISAVVTQYANKNNSNVTNMYCNCYNTTLHNIKNNVQTFLQKATIQYNYTFTHCASNAIINNITQHKQLNSAYKHNKQCCKAVTQLINACLSLCNVNAIVKQKITVNTVYNSYAHVRSYVTTITLNLNVYFTHNIQATCCNSACLVLV